MKAFGERLRSLRLSKGFTQESLASASGVAKRAIQRIEAGDEANPELKTLLAIGGAINHPLVIFDVDSYVPKSEHKKALETVVKDWGRIRDRAEKVEKMNFSLQEQVLEAKEKLRNLTAKVPPDVITMLLQDDVSWARVRAALRPPTPPNSFSKRKGKKL